MTRKTASPQGKPKIRVGLIGCGVIGKALAKAVGQPPLSRQAQVVALHDRQDEKARALARRLRPTPDLLSMRDVIRRSEIVLEAASPSAVGPLLEGAGRYKRDLLIMSTAGLLQSRGLLRQALKAGCRISIPSGALIGVDGLKAFSVGTVQKVTLTTRKPPRSFGLNKLPKAKVLFEGPALKAVRAFPQNVNVAATVVLAGIPLKKFRVKVIADPALSRNTHELSAEGKNGRLFCRVENLPSENPKTSRLALLSAIAALRQMFQTIQVGT